MILIILLNLRNNADEEITYDIVEKNNLFSPADFGDFDF